MKDKIIKILMSETFNVSDEAGNNYIVISSEDFADIVEKIEMIASKRSELFCRKCEKKMLYNDILNHHFCPICGIQIRQNCG